MPRATRTYHVGWLAVAAQNYTLDYQQGFFPLSESGYIADAAALATGRLDATVFNHKLWDLAPTLPVLEAVGFSLYRWPDLQAPPVHVADLFSGSFACRELWIVSPSKILAARLAGAIRRQTR
jgi:hypothetical protein